MILVAGRKPTNYYYYAEPSRGSLWPGGDPPALRGGAGGGPRPSSSRAISGPILHGGPLGPCPAPTRLRAVVRDQQ